MDRHIARTAVRRAALAAALVLTASAAMACGTLRYDHPVEPLAGVDDPDRIWAILAESNDMYVRRADHDPAEHARRVALAKSQAPRIAILACADSRCSPELIFRRKPGDLFVVRTAGNIADSVAIGSLEYSVAVLGSKAILVVGHQHCGAVKAAVAGKPTGSAHIDGIVAQIRPAVDAVPPGGDEETRIELAIRENVRASGRHLVDASPLLAEAVRSGTLRILLAVHDLETGEVRRID